MAGNCVLSRPRYTIVRVRVQRNRRTKQRHTIHALIFKSSPSAATSKLSWAEKRGQLRETTTFHSCLFTKIQTRETNIDQSIIVPRANEVIELNQFFFWNVSNWRKLFFPINTTTRSSEAVIRRKIWQEWCPEAWAFRCSPQRWHRWQWSPVWRPAKLPASNPWTRACGTFPWISCECWWSLWNRIVFDSWPDRWVWPGARRRSRQNLRQRSRSKGCSWTRRISFLVERIRIRRNRRRKRRSHGRMSPWHRATCRDSRDVEWCFLCTVWYLVSHLYLNQRKAQD